jgi:hypothetical protein
MSILQDVPVNMLSPSQIASFVEPLLPDPEVYIMMPPLKLLRNVVDRMKNIDDYLTIQANMAGEFTLKVETDMVSVATFYRNLDHPHIGTFSSASFTPLNHTHTLSLSVIFTLLSQIMKLSAHTTFHSFFVPCLIGLI